MGQSAFPSQSTVYGYAMFPQNRITASELKNAGIVFQVILYSAQILFAVSVHLCGVPQRTRNCSCSPGITETVFTEHEAASRQAGASLHRIFIGFQAFLEIVHEVIIVGQLLDCGLHGAHGMAEIVSLIT